MLFLVTGTELGTTGGGSGGGEQEKQQREGRGALTGEGDGGSQGPGLTAGGVLVGAEPPGSG